MYLPKMIIYYSLLVVSAFQVGHAILEQNTSETIAYLANVISEGLAQAATHKLPTSAKEYEAIEDGSDIGTYDFVIVGGGTTGCIIARRLSEIGKWKVLVLEAGKWPDYDFLQFLTYFLPVRNSVYGWGYQSIPQTTACLGMVDHKCRATTGRGLGGSTLINAGVYQRGDPEVYDKWAKLLKDPSWSHINLLNIFKKSENFEHKNPWAPVDENYHGTKGPMNVTQVLPPDQLTGAFLAANQKLGLKVGDHNGPSQKVASILQLYSKNGKRLDVGTAFLQPVLNRTNLEVLTESYVTKIDVDKSTKDAKGVIFTRHGKIYYVKAKKEVIISAGVFSSPRILMHSGIGPEEHLKEVGIDVIRDLEVGSGLSEDVLCENIVFESGLYIPAQQQWEVIQDFLHGTGQLTSSFRSQGVAWYETGLNKDLSSADLELYCSPTTPYPLKMQILGWKNESYSAQWGNATNPIQMTIVNVNSLSKGSVRLRSNDPFEYPLIDFNLLSDPEEKDIEVMYQGIQLAFELMKTPSLQRLGLRYVANPQPGCEEHEFLSKEYWYCFLRHTSVAGYHSRGTCPIGVDPRRGAVVDSNLKVFGIKKLRVADASIFPTTTAGHTSAPCMMVGEKISGVIKSEYL